MLERPATTLECEHGLTSDRQGNEANPLQGRGVYQTGKYATRQRDKLECLALHAVTYLNTL